MEHTKWAREYFKDDRFATEAAGANIDLAEENHAVCSIEIENKHLNAVNAVMGGAIFTVADFAFAVASNSETRKTVSQTSQITYLGKVKGTKLIAESKCIKSGKSTCFFITEVKDDLENLVAMVTTTGFVVDS